MVEYRGKTLRKVDIGSCVCQENRWRIDKTHQILGWKDEEHVGERE